MVSVPKEFMCEGWGQRPQVGCPGPALMLLACTAMEPGMGQMLGMRQRTNQIQTLPFGSLGWMRGDKVEGRATTLNE